MGSVKMGPAFVHKDGTADTAPCVSDTLIITCFEIERFNEFVLQL